MNFSEDNLYGSGLPRDDWYLLRNAILRAAHDSQSPSADFDLLPERLQLHPIGRIVRQHLDGDDSASLTAAANLMVGGMDNAWLALEKS